MTVDRKEEVLLSIIIKQEAEQSKSLAQQRAIDDAGELLVFASLQTHSLILGMREIIRSTLAVYHTVVHRGDGSPCQSS